MSEVVEVTPPTETFPVVVKAVWVLVNCMVFDVVFPTFAVSSREFPVPTKIEPILIFWVSKFEVLRVAFLISKLPWGVPIGISSTMEGGFFKRKSPKELWFLQSGRHLGGNLFGTLGVFEGI
tara:strand:+ start:210 stop:575 length:366 start_codon:yes stop_codon:yes gene_type:complete